MKKSSAIVLAILVGGLGLVANQIATPWNSTDSNLGSNTVPFFGQHQSGIEIQRQANVTLVALNLIEGSDIESVDRKSVV